MKIDDNRFKFIDKISHTGIPNSCGSHDFSNCDIVHNANNYNHEFLNTLQIKYSKNKPQAQ